MLHSFHDRNKAFPPGYYDTGTWPDDDVGTSWGWASYLLADLEQPDLQKTINIVNDLGDSAPPVVTARTTFLPILWCPSDVLLETFTVTDGGTNSWTLAQASYVACNGNDGVDDNIDPPAHRRLLSSPHGVSVPRILRMA